MSYKPKLKKLNHIDNEPYRMTCIIGGKCNGGVVLVADRKIRDKEMGTVTFEEKLISKYFPIVFGASGSNILFKKFLPQSLYLLQPKTDNNNIFKQKTFPVSVSGEVHIYPPDSKPVIVNKDNSVNFFPYIKQLENIVKSFNTEYPRLEIEILIGLKTINNNSLLVFIDKNGTSEDIHTYRIIGSGTSKASSWIHPLYRKDISMEEFAKLGYFVIKYLDKFNLDDGVGLNGLKPQIWFIPNINDSFQLEDVPSLRDKFELETNKMLDNFEKYGIEKLLDRK